FLADAAYEASSPLGLRDAALLTWAGMRGAITLAAASTLPETFPHRSLLVLVAFIVATASIVIQGSTLGWVVRKLHFPPPDAAVLENEREALRDEILAAGRAVLANSEMRAKYGEETVDRLSQRLTEMSTLESMYRGAPLVDEIFDAQRRMILDARRDGVYSAEALSTALQRIDAMQLGMGLTRRGRVGDDD
ncbi:MAG TPA: cation:proton antiporter, partial [Kofleriaceae bacterium]